VLTTAYFLYLSDGNAKARWQVVTAGYTLKGFPLVLCEVNDLIMGYLAIRQKKPSVPHDSLSIGKDYCMPNRRPEATVFAPAVSVNLYMYAPAARETEKKHPPSISGRRASSQKQM
jgi:hypothetical protein